MSEIDIKLAIDDLVDKLTVSNKTIEKLQANLRASIEKTNELQVELTNLKEEQNTWAETAQLRESELNVYKQRKTVGKEIIEDYFGKIFEKAIDEFMGHLHHSKKKQAEELISLTDKQRKTITELIKNQGLIYKDFLNKFSEENDDGLGEPC